MNTDHIVDLLARLLNNQDRALLVVQRAGYPPQSTPTFSDPLVFWNRVVTDSENGVLAGGPKRLLEAAYALTQNPEVWSLLHAPDARIDELVGLLATCFHDADQASQMVTRAGFAVPHLPRWDDPATFWTKIVNQGARGAFSLVSLVDQALRLLPSNARFLSLRRSLDIQPIKPPVPPPPPTTPVTTRGLSVDDAMARLVPLRGPLATEQAISRLCQAILDARAGFEAGNIEAAKAAIMGAESTNPAAEPPAAEPPAAEPPTAESPAPARRRPARPPKGRR